MVYKMTVDPFGNNDNKGKTEPQGPQGPPGPASKGDSYGILTYRGYGPFYKDQFQFSVFWRSFETKVKVRNNALIAPVYPVDMVIKRAFVNIITDPIDAKLPDAAILDLFIDGVEKSQKLVIDGESNKKKMYTTLNLQVKAGQVFNIRTSESLDPENFKTIMVTYLTFEYANTTADWTIEPNGGLQLNKDNQIALAPMKLLWSGFDSEGSIKLNDSPENYRMIHCTSEYEEGRIDTSNFCPSAIGLKISEWYVNVGTDQVLTFSGNDHKTVTITAIGKLRFALNSVYGQL